MAELKYEVERGDDSLRVRLEEDLDMHLAPELKAVFHREFAAPPPDVVIDLAKVPFIDSSIIATLVDALRLVRGKGATLRVENCQPAVKDTFEITRLNTSFGIE